MSFLNALAGLPWDWVCFGGGLGGALNAAFSSNLKPFPAWSRSTSGPRLGHVTRIGLVVSCSVGAAASLALLWALAGMANFENLEEGLMRLRLIAASVFVGFVTARGLTSEVDKVLLRRAVR